MTQAAVQSAPLTAHDLCDLCGAQAYLQLTHATAQVEGRAMELLFCAHHAKENQGPAVAKGFAVTIDDTHKINSAPSPAAY